MYVRSMAAAVSVPRGLADLPPGPELGVLLAGIDVSRVPNGRILEVLRAESRQLAHQQARLFAAMAEVGRCESPRIPGRCRAGRGAVAGGDPRDRAGVGRHHGCGVRRARPGGAAAGAAARGGGGAAGRGDRPVEGAVVRRACPGAVRGAGRLGCVRRCCRGVGLTTGQLGDRLRRWCLSLLDPDVLRKRYQKAMRERGVSGYLNRDGTATISASGLSPAEAAASCERVFELARAIRRAGHPDRVSRIRADLFLALLDGSLQQLTNDQIIAAMLARREAQETGMGEAGAGEGEPESPPVGAAREARRPRPSPRRRPGPPRPRSRCHPSRSPRRRRRPVRALRCGCGCPPCSGSTSSPPRSPVGARSRPARLVSWWPASAAGSGASPSPTRGLPAAGRGHPPPARPRRHRARRGWGRGAAGPARVAAPAGRRARTGLAAADRRPRRAVRPPRPAPGGPERLPRGPVPAHGAASPHRGARPHLRVSRLPSPGPPGAAGPHGGVPARRRHGGEQSRGVVHHHALKTAGGWRLHQPAPGRFTWHSPLRRTYRTRGEPITPPLPEPILGEPDPEDLDAGPDPRVADRDDPPNLHPPTHPVERPPPQPPPGSFDEPPF